MKIIILSETLSRSNIRYIDEFVKKPTFYSMFDPCVAHNYPSVIFAVVTRCMLYFYQVFQLKTEACKKNCSLRYPHRGYPHH